MINWFPGHMKKTYDEIEKNKKKISFIIQIIDSRAITFSSNSELIEFFKDFAILNVALKSDIADLNNNKSKDNIFLSKNMNSIKKIIINELNKILKKNYEFSFFSPTQIGMVVGLPNIGKSTFINKIATTKKAIVMNMPGTTKNIVLQKISDKLFLYDSPGVMYKKIDNLITGYVLSLIGTISKKVLPLNDVLKFGILFLKKYYKKLYLNLFDDFNKKNFDEEINYLSKKWNFLSAENNGYDIVLNKLYDMFINGTIGKISYDYKDLTILI